MGKKYFSAYFGYMPINLDDASKRRRGYKATLFTSKKKSSLLNYHPQTFISIPVRSISSTNGSLSGVNWRGW